jgi:leucyl-tRNA synthetase
MIKSTNDIEKLPFRLFISWFNCPINIVNNDVLNIDKFREDTRFEYYKNDVFLCEDNKYICGYEIEKMSKSKWNVENPDDLVEKYGADTLRMYEMFLGPIEQSKPWDTKGIEGVFRFIRKFWKLYHDAENEFCISDEIPTKQELKILHKTIKKVQEDIEKLSFNTTVSAFMICVNELTDAKCNKRAILEPLSILIAPFAPHLAEELWSLLGHGKTVVYAQFPQLDESVLEEDTFSYSVSFNGKTRFMLELSLSLSPKEVEDAVLQHADAQRWLEGKPPKKVIVVPKKIVNVVV